LESWRGAAVSGASRLALAGSSAGTGAVSRVLRRRSLCVRRAVRADGAVGAGGPVAWHGGGGGAEVWPVFGAGGAGWLPRGASWRRGRPGARVGPTCLAAGPAAGPARPPPPPAEPGGRCRRPGPRRWRAAASGALGPAGPRCLPPRTVSPSRAVRPGALPSSGACCPMVWPPPARLPPRARGLPSSEATRPDTPSRLSVSR